ncbi:MAG: hypothetical protein JWN48_3989 [Myxococcaceae bacterium]|nr:hypothetical protein [Myxococcaceae bacterium]
MRTLLVTLLLPALSCLTSLASSASSAQAQNYVGVVPGSDTVTENLAAAPGEAALVTWPGFQMLPDGGSRVFVQTSIGVSPQLKREGQSDNWQLLLTNVALPAGNARRPLDTSFFNTPVKSVRTLARGKGVVVLLAMRAKLMPVVRTERAASGYFFTYLEFPAGSFL